MDFTTFSEKLSDSVDGMDVSGLRPEQALRDLPQWDSLAVLTFISMCDMDYSVSVTADEIQNCTTVGDLHQLLAGKIA